MKKTRRKARAAVLAAALAATLSCASGCGSARPDESGSAGIEPGSSVTASFAGRVDGDTAWFEIGGERARVRFLGIDAPETAKEGEEPQPWADEASDFTGDALEGASEIVLEFDPESDLTDGYGRLLAWVFADGGLLNEELVRNGYARVAYVYGDYAYLGRLEGAEAEAEAAGAGIWEE